MFNYRYLRYLDFRALFMITGLMFFSLLIISSMTQDAVTANKIFFTAMVKTQLKWFVLGWACFLFFALLDYQKLHEWSWILYGISLLLLIGLFFTSPIQNVHRWYRVPLLNFALQPSEMAKLTVVIALSWYLEKSYAKNNSWTVICFALCIVLIPFFLIVKQPDLGTALVLYPITLVMFYFGGIRKSVVRLMTISLASALIFVSTIFLGIISHEKLHPFMTKFLKEYQYERLNPHTYHQMASQTAIALGKIWGSGWQESEYSSEGWLPASSTDSVFPAFVEEFGLVGAFFMLTFFFGLIYFSFRVAAVAKDNFGRLLSTGIAAYIAIHAMINIGMMCGFFPITGVPLILVSYGGSSVLSTMMALGILQSIYIRRFTF